MYSPAGYLSGATQKPDVESGPIASLSAGSVIGNSIRLRNAKSVICLVGPIFAGIRMMSGRFQDAIPGASVHSLAPAFSNGARAGLEHWVEDAGHLFVDHMVWREPVGAETANAVYAAPTRGTFEADAESHYERRNEKRVAGLDPHDQPCGHLVGNFARILPANSAQ